MHVNRVYIRCFIALILTLITLHAMSFIVGAGYTTPPPIEMEEGDKMTVQFNLYPSFPDCVNEIDIVLTNDLSDVIELNKYNFDIKDAPQRIKISTKNNIKEGTYKGEILAQHSCKDSEGTIVTVIVDRIPYTVIVGNGSEGNDKEQNDSSSTDSSSSGSGGSSGGSDTENRPSRIIPTLRPTPTPTQTVTMLISKQITPNPIKIQKTQENNSTNKEDSKMGFNWEFNWLSAILFVGLGLGMLFIYSWWKGRDAW